MTAPADIRAALARLRDVLPVHYVPMVGFRDRDNHIVTDAQHAALLAALNALPALVALAERVADVTGRLDVALFNHRPGDGPGDWPACILCGAISPSHADENCVANDVMALTSEARRTLGR